MKSISVVIPCFNAKNTLERAILSVIQQTYPYKELIIIDGLSNDGSLEIIAKYNNQIDYTISEKDKGIYDAINKGVQAAKGDWVYILGADDELYSNLVLETISNFLSQDVDVISGKIINENKENLLVPSVFTPSASWIMFFKNSLHQQGTFYRKSSLPIPPFDPTYQVLSDYRTHLYLKKKSARIELKALVVAKCSASGLSKKFNTSLYWEEWNMKKDMVSMPWLILNGLTIPIKFFLKKLF